MRSMPPLREPPAGGAQPGPVLCLERLSVTFAHAGAGAGVPAVSEVSLQVGRGECLGVVGESGAGKSQTFLAALGLLPRNARVQGSARLGTEELIGRSEAELDRIRGARVGMIFQDPMTSLTPHLRVGEQIAEPIVRHTGMSSREARRRALGLLERTHVADAARRFRQYPHELSGGMRQRVMIAIALACDPQLLIADEPTTALDVTIQAQILSLLAELKRERGMAMVLVTHDFGAVAGLADRVAVMRAGRIVESGSCAEVIRRPREPYTRELLGALADRPLGQRAEGVTDGCAPGSAPGEATLAVSNLGVSFRVSGGFARARRLRALDEVSFELRAGRALGVVGESGSGKSTLARAILALIRPSAGGVAWRGARLCALPARKLREIRRELQIVFQDPLASLDPRMSVERIVAEPLAIHAPGLARPARRERVRRMLERVGLAPQLAARHSRELSGGQCQRVGIARAMILAPRLLVCDEPLSALDVSSQRQVLELLSGLKREHGMSIVLVSHNLGVVRRLCDHVLVLYLGRMMELAPARSLFERPLHPYTRELLDAVPIPDPQVQPGRLARIRAGEPPSPLEPPRGCVFRTRCPHAVALCAERAPPWEPAGADRWVACHRFRELGGAMLSGS
jgi:oligopeptide/dipeptide ABC transporter ATP-binding protein